jgi:hypothetical protein
MTTQSQAINALKQLIDRQQSASVVEVAPSIIKKLIADIEALEDPRGFLDDLIPRREASKVLGMKAESMSVAHRNGQLPLTRYRRGREVYYSLREVVGYLREKSIGAQQTRVLKRKTAA